PRHDILRVWKAGARIAFAEAQLAASDVDWIAKLAIQPSADRRLVILIELLPIEGIKKLDEDVERLRLLFDPIKQGFGFMYFCDFGVRNAFEPLHGDGLRHCFLHGFVDEELATPSREPIHRTSQPESEQRISAAQVVVKEGERCANGEGMQPK